MPLSGSGIFLLRWDGRILRWLSNSAYVIIVHTMILD
jgi:hypothetical protein